MSEEVGIVARLNALGRANPDAEPFVLAAEFVAKTTKRELIPVVAREIEHGQRAAVKTITERAFAKVWKSRFAEPVELPDQSVDALTAFREVFAQTFALGDGVRVSFKEATLDQWQQRRSLLVTNIAGLQRDVDVCDEAIRLLEDSGAACLGDI